jgi:hypothetical protein
VHRLGVKLFLEKIGMSMLNVAVVSTDESAVTTYSIKERGKPLDGKSWRGCWCQVGQDAKSMPQFIKKKV